MTPAERAEYMREYRQRNREKLLAYKRAWYQRNKEHVKEYSAQYNREHREERNEHAREYYRANPEMRRAKTQRYRENHHEQVIRWTRSYTKQFRSKRKPANVYYDKSRDRWKVQVGIDGRDVHVGYFADKSDAERAAKRARKTLGVKKWGSARKYLPEFDG